MSEDFLTPEEQAKLRKLDVAHAQELREIDAALRTSAMANGLPAEALGFGFFDHRGGWMEDSPELANPLLADLPEVARWLMFATFVIAGDGVHVLADGVELGVWPQADVAKVVGSYLAQP